MQLTYIYYDTFNLMRKNLSRFTKDAGMEGAYNWRDINQNHRWSLFTINRPDNDCWNKSFFEALLYSVENGGEDPIVFIRIRYMEITYLEIIGGLSKKGIG